MIQIAKKLNATKLVEPLATDVKGAAQSLGLSERTIRTLIKEKRLPCKRVGWRCVIPISGIREFLEKDTAAESNETIIQSPVNTRCNQEKGGKE